MNFEILFQARVDAGLPTSMVRNNFSCCMQIYEISLSINNLKQKMIVVMHVIQI